MSKGLLFRVVLTCLLLGGTASALFAFANGDALTGGDATALVPSAVPALLGPIDERGRVGWECKPERAASATNAAAAELPQAPK